MIYTERSVMVKNGSAAIDQPIILYRGDRGIDVLFKVVDAKFKFNAEKGNYITNTEAAHGQLAILLPNGKSLFSSIAECVDGYVIFTISGDMIDEMDETGFYSFHIRLYSADRESRITIPPIEKGIEVREPIVIEDDGYVPDEPAVERMYIGYLPYDPEGIVGVDSLDVIGAGLTKKYIDGAVQGGTLKEVPVSTMGKTSLGIVPESAYACCIYPASKNFTVTIDNGIGGKEVMTEKCGDYAVNDKPLDELVGGVQYKVSGFLSSMQGERFFYVD